MPRGLPAAKTLLDDALFIRYNCPDVEGNEK